MPTITQETAFSLFDISGKEVLQQKIVGVKSEVFVGKLPKGMYFYEVIVKDRKEYGKVFIE